MALLGQIEQQPFGAAPAIALEQGVNAEVLLFDLP